MVAKFIPIGVFTITMALGCAENIDSDIQTDLNEAFSAEDFSSNVDSAFQDCDSVYTATYHGTACCISGATEARPGDIATYHYQINHKDPQMSREIREGDISILTGHNAPTVTVQFGPNFTTGIVGCVGSGVKEGFRLECSDRCIVQTPL